MKPLKNIDVNFDSLMAVLSISRRFFYELLIFLIDYTTGDTDISDSEYNPELGI